jgi:hypothetical protein
MRRSTVQSLPLQLVFPGDTVIVEAVAAANVNRALDNQPLASMMYLSAVMNLMGGVS